MFGAVMPRHLSLREQWKVTYRDCRRARWMLSPGQLPEDWARHRLQMSFGAVFPRSMRPVFGPGLATVAAGVNWWEAGGASGCVAAYQPKGAASLAASYVNLANPGTYDAAPGVAPTWASGTGWTFNGTTQYMITANVSENSTVLVQFSGVSDSSTARALFGCYQAVGLTFRVQPSRGNAVRYGNEFPGIAPGMSSGNVCQAGTAGYRNGALDASGISIGLPGERACYIGALEYLAAAANFLACNVQAFAIYNTTLTAPQVAAISTAMAAL